ncbi:MAG: PQQ-binding-like beta-propeller repeat protein [Treponema sp.]|jgi:outer membrane protein assembly factor BamB|nr:PQQ-binding-like beta-propeller repeat protein [Treponema sp.]
MRFLLKACIFLLFTFSAFAQNESREQGLVTSDPYWRQALGGAVLSLPHVQVQSAVVALDGGNIRAYSTAGTPMWNYSARGRISPFVTRSREGTSYFSRLTGILIAVNRAGRELWRRDLGKPLCARLITGWDGRLFAPTDKKIFCYTASGNLLWTKTFESSFAIAPKLDRGGGIIFSLQNNEVYRIDHFGNHNVWTVYNTVVEVLPIEQGRIIVLYTDGTMEVLGISQDWYIPAEGDVTFSTLPRLPAVPLAAISKENNVIATLADGRIVFVSVGEGRIIWTANSHIREMINSRGRPDTEVEMFCDERGIYVLNKNGASCFTYDGERLWFTFLQDAAAVPAFGNDGVLYSGGRDWILYAYKIEDRVLPDRVILYGPAPEGSYGMGRPQSIYMVNIPFNENETRAKLEQIAEGINSGRVGSNEPYWTSLLLSVAAEQQPIQFRIAALNLLGKIGSQETLPWLINIFHNDNEPLIKTTAINAIGDIGVDPQGIAIQAFLYSIIGGGIRDEMVLTAIASATGALCRFSGPPLSETGVRILNLLNARSQPPSTRRQAGRELSSLR